jgi:hypothetical protein
MLMSGQKLDECKPRLTGAGSNISDADDDEVGTINPLDTTDPPEHPLRSSYMPRTHPLQTP